VPSELLEFVAAQLQIPPKLFVNYARERATTRREHLVELYHDLGLTQFSEVHYTALRDWLLNGLAATTDQPLPLMTALMDELRKRLVVLPAFSRLEKLVGEVRRAARRQIWQALTNELSTALQRRGAEIIC
jgi:Domain of unknown function (DUF4158)